MVIYIDGVKNASSSGITLRPSDIAPTLSYLGRSQFIADPAFKGYMSNVRIYNYALTANEVKALTSTAVMPEDIAAATNSAHPVPRLPARNYQRRRCRRNCNKINQPVTITLSIKIAIHANPHKI